MLVGTRLTPEEPSRGFHLVGGRVGPPPTEWFLARRIQNIKNIQTLVIEFPSAGTFGVWHVTKN